MNRRILLVDDTKSIHEDFRKILCPQAKVSNDLASARAAFFGTDSPGDAPASSEAPSYDLTSAFQGEEALQLLEGAIEAKERFAVAFVDVRMPPGWDGVQTIKQLWKADPDLHCVICTAFSDYSWDETVAELGHTDKLLILKKPFDPTEIRQVASAFTSKVDAAHREREAMAVISQKEIEARAYASSLETLNKALATSKASADRMSVMKSEFMLRLTGEVSTHLNAILDRLVVDGQTEGLDEALDKSQALLETIDKVVDFTEVEAGTLLIENDPCNLRDVVDDVVTTYRGRAVEKGLVFESNITDSVPEVVQTDARRLCQILGNLVDNAVRYTDSGSVKFSVRTEPSDSWEQTRLRFDVEDSGRGIEQDRVGRIFEPFSSRVDASLAEGSGLGLTVAKQLARLLGGDVSFEPNPENGCKFTLGLDVRRMDPTHS